MHLDGIKQSDMSNSERQIPYHLTYKGIWITQLRERETRVVATRTEEWENWDVSQRVQTCKQEISKIWESNAQHSNYRQQYCINHNTSKLPRESALDDLTTEKKW